MDGMTKRRYVLFISGVVLVAAAIDGVAQPSKGGAANTSTTTVTVSGAGASSAISGNATVSTATWGHAIQVPGTAGYTATVNSVSCPKAGTCAAGGQFSRGPNAPAFVIDETNGSWGNATRVRFAVGGKGTANVTSVSCATGRNCAAAGWYTDGSHHFRAFVVDERKGRWRTAINVTGVAAFSGVGYSIIDSVSCGTPGNCAAGGEYSNVSKHGAFVVEETNGTWHKAIPVPGLATLSGGSQAVVQSVSCATAGNCAAGGFYFSSDGTHAFLANETNGVWGNAIEVPGTAALGAGDVGVSSLSCGAAGNCAAGGVYIDAADRQHAFVVDETNGSWGNAIEVPGTATLNSGGRAEVTSISCATAGNCAAAGSYTDGTDFATGHPHTFVVDETNGSWGTAVEPPGIGVDAVAKSISCATAGNCTVTGTAGGVFVADETNGSWGNAIVVPGTAGVDGIGVNSVSCGAPGVCVVGGYHDGHGGDQVAFVAGSGTRPLTVPSPPHLKSAAPGNGKITATWSKPADKGGVPIAGYRATAKAGHHVFTCTTKSKLGCTIAGLKNGTTYTVTVVAKNTVGRSKPSNSKKARPRR